MANKKKNRKKAAAAKRATAKQEHEEKRKQEDEHTLQIAETKALERKARGNEAFQKGDFKEAVSCYRKALAVLNSAESSSVDLQIDLHNNVSMALIRMHDYEQSEAECTYVLEKISKTNAKVWYRRAIAREGRAAEDPKLLEGCLEDLQKSWELLEPSSEKQMKRSVQGAMKRIRILLEQNSTSVEAPLVLVEPVLSGVTRQVQKETVLKLLIARQETLSQHPQMDEALFVIDWDWWIDWGLYVGFWESPIVHHLPRGAVQPDPEELDDGAEKLTPGPIDNTSLVLIASDQLAPAKITSTYQYFARTWYKHLFHPDESHVPLKPNLVRGYHYELIPREVYSALQSWYGEVSQSICRRSSNIDEINLYPTWPAEKPEGEERCHGCRVYNATMRCKRCMSVYYCGRSCQESHWSFHKSSCKRLEKMTMEKRTIVELSNGDVGLSNLGNTCFLNSALQCLSHATPLTRHFLSNLYLMDLNKENPLGTGGKLAQAFAEVLKELWMRRGASSAKPISLKRAIATFAPRFAGTLQHDAQEFLAYLLDGLHEDLNRVRSKPYVELPDIGAEHCMNIAGARVWDATSRRDDSLVVDTFYGQFKSTCVCPRCNKVSVAFDAFNHVSLELPSAADATVHVKLMVMPTSTENENSLVPTRYVVPSKRSSRILSLKLELAHQLGEENPNGLNLCEVEDNQIVSYLRNSDTVGSGALSTRGYLLACKGNPIEGEEPIFQVFCAHTYLNEDGLAGPELFGVPFLISLDLDVSCRQMWEAIWSRVGHYIHPENQPPSEEDKDLLQVHFVQDLNGKPCQLFQDIENPANSNGEDILTSKLPRDSEERIIEIFGPQSRAKFLFVRLAWVHQDDKLKPGTIAIKEERFSFVRSHESWNDYKATPATKGVTLDECLDAFTKPERLDEQNMWYCSNCKEHVQAMKTMKLWRLPNILIVHLKRFEFRHTLRREKLETFVRFPIDGLNMDRHCVREESSSRGCGVPAMYDLFAVTNHYGRMGFGHYTAFARNWDENGIDTDWSLFDDSRAEAVAGGAEDSVVSPAAYILFYRRRQFS